MESKSPKTNPVFVINPNKDRIRTLQPTENDYARKRLFDALDQRREQQRIQRATREVWDD